MGQADRTVSLLTNLSNGDRPVEELLSGNRVSVSLGSGVSDNTQAQLTFSFVVNLLARLHPVLQELNVILPKVVTVKAPLARWKAPTLDGHILALLEALDPPVHWTVDVLEQVPGDELKLVVLSPDTGQKKQRLCLASNGWEAAISATQPISFGAQVNPIGAFTTACFGTSEAWKLLLYPHRDLFPGVPICPLQDELVFSTFTYRTARNEPNPTLPGRINLKRLTMVGLGAGGGAAAFTLASLTSISGLITLVEPDEIIDHNLNRYIYADSSDAQNERAKADVIAAMLSCHSDLDVFEYSEPYDEIEGQLSPDDYQYVIAAVHTRAARRDLQYETPMVLWDAGATEFGEFKIWRLILGKTECMWCKHPPNGEDPELQKAQQLSKLLGLDATTWRRKLTNNESFSEHDIEVINQHVNGGATEFDLPLIGQRFGDWEAEHCGKLQLPDADDEIPIPFAPVMAGVLLAGEVIKEHYYPRKVLDSYYWNTLLGKFMRRNLPKRRLPREECSLCGDLAYLDQYRRRWRNS